MFNSFQFNSTKYNTVAFFEQIVSTLVVSGAIPLTAASTVVALGSNEIDGGEYPDADSTAGLKAGIEALALSPNNETVILR